MPSVSYALRGAIAGLALLALNACATKNIDRNYALDETSGKGVVIGSITYSGTYASYSVYYRKVGGGTAGRFQFGQGMYLFPPLEKDDIRGRGLRGDVFAAELPAGDYEIYSWHVGSGYALVGPSNPFTIRYHIEPGKSVYLGNFHFQRRERLLGGVTGAMLTYKDEAERDLKIFATKYPKLGEFEIGSSIEKGQVYDDLGEGYQTVITVPIVYVVH
jgi:hypothetical protein